MDEDQIFRRAYWKSLPAGLLVAALLTLAVGALGAGSPRIVMHPVLRIAISYGVIWCVMHAMFRGGGGIMGFKVTATAWVLANTAMLASFLLIPVLQDGPPPTTPAVPPTRQQDEALVLGVTVLLVLQGAGTTIAGWVHGD